MNRHQFFEKLNNGLSVLPRSERMDILKYYNEIFDDKMEEGISEETIIHQLGSIDEIVANALNYDKTSMHSSKETVDSKSDYSPFEKSEVKEETQANQQKDQSKRERNRIILVVAICTFYIWLPILLGILGAVFGIIMGALACVFSFIVAGFACVVSGAAATIWSIVTIFSNPALGLCELGISLGTLGVGCLILWSYKYLVAGAKWLFASIKKLISRYKRSKI